MRDGTVRRGWLGVEPRDLSPELIESLNLPVKSGVLITGVLQDGPAARGGLHPGDVVTAIAGKPIQSTADLFAAVASLVPGSTAVLRVQRGAQALDLRLQVAERGKAQRQGR